MSYNNNSNIRDIEIYYKTTGTYDDQRSVFVSTSHRATETSLKSKYDFEKLQQVTQYCNELIDFLIEKKINFQVMNLPAGLYFYLDFNMNNKGKLNTAQIKSEPQMVSTKGFSVFSDILKYIENQNMNAYKSKYTIFLYSLVIAERFYFRFSEQEGRKIITAKDLKK